MLILELVLNGILLGALYACIGISFSLIWGVMNIINLAHGSMIMLGAYIAFFLFSALGLDPFLAIPVSGGVLFVIGYAVQRYVINLVIRGSIFLTLILTFGFDMVLSNALLAIFTADTRSVSHYHGRASQNDREEEDDEARDPQARSGRAART